MIFLGNRTHFSGWSQLFNNFNKTSLKHFFVKKYFVPVFYCLKCFAELKNDINKQYSSFLVMIAQQLQQNFHKKKFVRKYFVPVFIVWNALLTQLIIFLSNRNYFSGWSRLFNNSNKIFLKNFCQKIFCLCFFFFWNALLS